MKDTLEPPYAITHFVSNQEQDDQNTLSIKKFIAPVELNPLSETLMVLSNFKNIGNNWDGYQAKSPKEQTVDNAEYFVKLLPATYQKALYSDELGLTPYGTVTLEWKAKGENFLSIEIGISKIGYLSETEDGENPFKESIDFDSRQIPEDVLQVFKKVFA